MSGTSGITTITLTADENLDFNTISSGFTLQNANRQLYMGAGQKQFVPSGDYLILQPASVNFGLNGGRNSIRVFSNQDWVLQCSDWIDLSQTSGRGNALVNYDVSMNMEGVTRNGFISGYSVSDSSITATTVVSQEWSIYGDRAIMYTSTDGQIVTPITASTAWGANIVSNTYADGVGIIEFDDDITLVPEYAFNGRSTLLSIILPKKVLTIGYMAFAKTSLSAITIDEQIEGIDYFAFHRSDLRHINFNAIDAVALNTSAGLWSATNDITLTIGNSVERINPYMFQPAQSSTQYPSHGRFTGELIVPNSVTYIGDGAFEGGMYSALTLSNSLTTIGQAAFQGCSALSTIYSYANTCPTVGRLAFINLPSSGILHYPSGSDYSAMISRLPSGWTAIGDL